MNPVKIVTVTASAVVVGVAIAKNRKTVKAEREKRAEIDRETAKQLEALNVAAKLVERKIAKGDYDHNLSIPAILDDFEFYRMTARYED